ncbi:hypothetical protein NB717_003875 [Xanthomonas sacchari]|nr:hypothetical protein [Xanthomonas sacchari]
MSTGRATASLTLPVQGMTCAACAAGVEKALQRLPGVAAQASYAGARVQVDYDPQQVDLPTLLQRIQHAGYRVPTQTVTLELSGLHCASCVAAIDAVLAKTPGVLAGHANLASAKARVEIVPGASAASGTPGDASWACSPRRCCSPCRSGGRCSACWMATPCAAGTSNRCRAGCSCCSPPRCSAGSARVSTAPATARCATAAPTWMCWSRWAPAWLICTAPWSPWPACTASMCTSRPAPASSPWCCSGACSRPAPSAAPPRRCARCSTWRRPPRGSSATASSWRWTRRNWRSATCSWSLQASACRSTARYSRAIPVWTRPCFPARPCRWPRRRAVACTRPRSTS